MEIGLGLLEDLVWEVLAMCSKHLLILEGWMVLMMVWWHIPLAETHQSVIIIWVENLGDLLN